jgi:hypothetical protein
MLPGGIGRRIKTLRDSHILTRSAHALCMPIRNSLQNSKPVLILKVARLVQQFLGTSALFLSYVFVKII